MKHILIIVFWYINGQRDYKCALIEKEATRQSNTIELIASENHVSPAVMKAVGNLFNQ